jgi:hypothetical protein
MTRAQLHDTAFVISYNQLDACTAIRLGCASTAPSPLLQVTTRSRVSDVVQGACAVLVRLHLARREGARH